MSIETFGIIISGIVGAIFIITFVTKGVGWLWKKYQERLRRRHVMMSIVRIKGADGANDGVGFLVSERHVLTCADVVARAISISDGTDQTPERVVHLDFPFHRNDADEAIRDYRAHVKHWQQAAGSDAAILQLTDNPDDLSLPTDARPARLIEAKARRKVRALIRFPGERDNDGTWTSGKIGQLRNSRCPFVREGENNQLGLSGGPVVKDRKLGLDRVVGMMVASTGDQEGFVIPTAVLVEPWPKLKPKPLVSAAVIFAIMGIVLGGILVYFLAPPDLGNNRSPSANVILYDGFSDPSSGWLEQKPEIGEVAEYTDDERYRIYGPPPDSYSVKLAPTGELGDVIVEVDATRIRDVPDEGISYWGIVCRAQDDDDDGEVDGGDYYLMIVGDNGNYGISKVIAGNEVKPSLASGDYNAAIYTEIEQTNWIRAECMGSKLALYVNGQRIAAVEDTEGPQFKTGKVGLLAGHESIDSPGSIDVLFDNFLARMP